NECWRRGRLYCVLGAAINELYEFIACGYHRNIISRFETYLPHLVHAVSQTRYLVPAVHIQNHQDNCMYQFAAAYILAAAHFHGETAEQPWIMLNELGPQIRQMSHGGRQESIIDSNNDWNWKKTARMSLTLFNDLIHARNLYFQHKHRFESLTQLHHSNVAKWDLMDREKRTMNGKEVDCVYRQSQRKIPSQKGLLEALTNTCDVITTSTPSSDALAHFINDGLVIQTQQHDLRTHLSDLESNSPLVSQKDVDAMASKLRDSIETWRTTQKSVAAQAFECAIKQLAHLPPITSECLFLPSDFSSADRTEFGFDELGRIESNLREGIAFDLISAVQQSVKLESVVWSQKQTQCRGQDQNTRALAQITRLKHQKANLIDLYNANRQALIDLGLPQASRSFPPLSVEDTRRMAPEVKRGVGDSRRLDGAVWHAIRTVARPVKPLQTMPLSSQQPHAEILSKSLALESSEKAVNIGDGWIWRLGSIGNLTSEELQAWEEEGDRVHWFRAEAEMERWREQWELKLVEFVRCIAHFDYTSQAWSRIADQANDMARRVYALKHAFQYKVMSQKITDMFCSAEVEMGEPTLYKKNENLIEYIIRHRQQEHSTSSPSFYTPRLFRINAMLHPDVPIPPP
ncbi:hypothetical protein CVT24_009906, partial [Panaeolus cyanescens]